MRSLRKLEKQLETLGFRAEKGILYMTLDDGSHIKINCGSPHGIIKLTFSAVKNEDFPYREYVKHAVSGVPHQGAFVMIWRAIIESIERIKTEKAGL